MLIITKNICRHVECYQSRKAKPCVWSFVRSAQIVDAPVQSGFIRTCSNLAKQLFKSRQRMEKLEACEKLRTGGLGKDL